MLQIIILNFDLSLCFFLSLVELPKNRKKKQSKWDQTTRTCQFHYNACMN